MPLPKNSEFIKRVLSHVKFKYDHSDISRELEEHMEDMYEDFLSEGMEEEAAVKMTETCMGDPDEIGEAINKEHSPLLGWLWRVSQAVLVFFIILSIVPVFNTALMAVYTVFSDYSLAERPPEEIVCRVKRDDIVRLDDMYFKLEEVLLYTDNSAEIRYKTWYRPFSDSIRWSFSLGRCITDDIGNEYWNGSGGNSAGFITKNYELIENFSSEAKTLIIDYDYNGRKIYIEVPLREGDGD